MFKVIIFILASAVCVSAEDCESIAESNAVAEKFLTDIDNFYSTCIVNITRVYDASVAAYESVPKFLETFNPVTDGCTFGIEDLVDTMKNDLAKTVNADPNLLQKYTNDPSSAPFAIQCIITIYRASLLKAHDTLALSDALNDKLYHRYIRCEGAKIEAANEIYCMKVC